MRVDLAFAGLDVFIVVAAYSFGMGLRSLDVRISDPVVLWQALFLAMPVILAVHLGANAVAGAYGHVWEHASTSEALRVVIANVAASGLLLGLSWLARQPDEPFVIPFTVIVIGGLLSLLGMGLVRFRSRLFSFYRQGGAIRTLVVGTGRDAVAFARAVPEIEEGRRVVGFVADVEKKTRSDRKLAGLEVIGCVDEIAALIEENDIDEVVVIGSDPLRARRVVDLCLDVEVRLRILPSAEDVMRPGVAAVDVRDIDVEDVLVRQPVETDLTDVRSLIGGKTVLVTGGGGSIGSEIVRQVLGFEPAAVWALDRDETLLHDAALRWDGTVHLALGDVRDKWSIQRTFDRVKPDIVFHAAALKHVPMLEEHAEEAVLTNIMGTRNVIEAGIAIGMERFVLISTDKAVEPANVMGATKRVAEMLTQASGSVAKGCVFTSVRFGNVLGSRGSVIPTFVEQIKKGGPVTVTDSAMTRYFMTVNEAVQLVLQSSALATGSELFLLDMGEPVKIDDLARRLIRLAGLTPGKDIEIVYTGRRPGEKLSEKLAKMPMKRTSHDKIYDVRGTPLHQGALMEKISQIEIAAKNGETQRLLNQLNEVAEGNLSNLSIVIDLTDDAIAWR